MLLAQDNQSTQTRGPAADSARSTAARMLAQGTLGARLIERARLAAAVHMAQVAAQRSPGAQDLRGAAE